MAEPFGALRGGSARCVTTGEFVIKSAANPEAIAAIESEVARIQALKLDQVRALWRDTFKKDVPKSQTRDLLVRALCWHIQEKAFGGHSTAILKLLASYARGKPKEADRLRRLKPGTEVVREYQGERHTVVIAADGFRWRDKKYPSLSAIARAITGSNWNGPRFFGLREGADGQKAGAAQTRIAARPNSGQGAMARRTPQ
jgi:hypothetical protein